MPDISYEQVKAVTLKLLEYCQANDWAGYDPYDALNSSVFKYLPFLDSRWPRIAFTQFLKRCPVNLRPLFRIPKTENPKAIALFLTAFLKIKRIGLLVDENLISLMTQKLINLRSPINSRNSTNPNNCKLQVSRAQGVNEKDQINEIGQKDPINPTIPYWCWGYSFPWQTRTILVPRGAPNLVCTSFVANALLDVYEQGCKPKMSYASSEAALQPSTFGASCLEMAVSAAEYIVNELYWTDGNSTACFSYPVPGIRSKVHNANFIGAALLCRVYKLGGEKKFLEPALKVVQYSASKQHDDGSWDYGELPTQQWIDNFHTGYNLCALRSIGQDAGTTEFEPQIRRGFEFYRKHFFREDGAPKYFHNRTYPNDIHSVAQSIITLLALKDLVEGNVSLTHSIFEWAMRYMWDEKGYFYYQVLPNFKNRIPYMRWSQAWMLLGLSTLLEHQEQTVSGTHIQAPTEKRLV